LEQKKKRWLPWSSKRGVDRQFQQLLDRIERSPDDPRLHQRLAEFYLERGQKGKAVEEFSKAAECHCEAGFYLRAIALYRRILRLQGESTKVLIKLGELYAINGLLGDALVHFKKVITRYRRDRKVRAIPSVLRRMVEVNPDSLEVRVKYIEVLRAEGFPSEALDELILLQGENKEKGSADFVGNLEEQIRSIYSELREQYIKGRQDHELALLEEKVKSVFQPREDVEVAASQQEPIEEEEIELAEEITEVEELPEEPKTASEEEISKQFQEAHLYLNQGLFDEAEAIFQGILAINPDHAEASQAMRDVSEQREQMMGSPGSSMAVQKSGASAVSSKPSERPDQGLVASGDDEEKPPDDARVRFELGLAYRELELIDECIGELLIAVQDPAMAFASHRELGVCYLQKGNLDEAIKHLKEAINCTGASQDEVLEVSYELAQILEQQGDRQQALNLYQKIEEKDQSFRDVQDRVKSLIQ
jgi:tetratricopeptide (TPR) repeat protein